LFSAAAGTTAAPPGLLYNVPPLTAATMTPITDAMTTDLATLAGAVARVAGASIIFIAAPEQAIPIAFWSPDFTYPVLTSKALPKGTIIAVASNALVSGFDAVPEIVAARDASLVMDTAPGAIGTTTQSTIGLFQSDRVSLKMRMPVAYALRSSSAIAWMQNTTW
jgi:hypothetical protein